MLGKVGNVLTKSRSHKIVAGQDRGGVVGVCIGEVVQDTIEKAGSPDGEEAAADWKFFVSVHSP